MTSPDTTDLDAVTAVNAELYAALEACDIDRMDAVWDRDDDVVCVHPGWPLLRGRSRVMRSWSMIMANTTYIQFFLTDVQARIDGDTAVVTCDENILAAGESGSAGSDEASVAPMQAAAVVATNVFRRRPDGWRLWLHHGSPVLSQVTDEESA